MGFEGLLSELSGVLGGLGKPKGGTAVLTC